jgi:RNA polymerase sigma-70 factor (ECF subfamily)
MSQKEPSDGALVARVRQGDAAAFDALVRRHYRVAYAVALAILGRRADAEDACQDAWIRALERLESCRKPERFVYWFLQIVRNRARNLLAAQRVRAAEPLASHQAIASASQDGRAQREYERRRLREQLEAALAQISEVQREVVLLHDLEGWTHRAIAEHLGISEVMSRQHLFQARRRLRAVLHADAAEE